MSSEIAKQTRVTVLLSTYNGSKFLQEQLDSLYQQTYPDIRILVRDDGSTDSTRSMLSREQAGGRIDMVEGYNNLGAALSFFELLHSATLMETEYVAFCDQDDVWHPEKIAHAVFALCGVPDRGPAMYCSRVEIVDEHLEHIGYSGVPKKIGFGNALVENVATGCTIVLNRKAIGLVGENLPNKVLIHDWWCYLVVSCFGKVVFGDSPDIKYRQHGGNTIGVAANMFDELGRKLRRYFGNGQGHLWISGQASSLQDKFQDRIPIHQRQILNNLSGKRSSLSSRLKLAISKDVWRQKRFDDLLLRFLILIDRI